MSLPRVVDGCSSGGRSGPVPGAAGHARSFVLRFFEISIILLAAGQALSVSLAALARALLLVAVCLVWWRHPELRFRAGRAGWALAAFAGWFLALSLVNWSAQMAPWFWHSVSQITLFLAGAMIVRDRILVARLLAFFWFGTLAALATLFQALSGFSFAALFSERQLLVEAGRASGFYHSAVTNGQMLAGLLIGAIGFFRGKPWRKIFACLAAALVAGALIATGTRSAWGGAGLGLLLLFSLWFGWRRAVPVFLATALALYLVLPVATRTRALSVFDGETGGYQLRTVIWRASLLMWADRPLTGVGPGNFRPAYASVWLARSVDIARGEGLSISEDTLADLRRHFHAHNDLLNLAATLGVPGLALFLWFWLAVVIRGIRHARERHRAGQPVRDNIPLLALAILLGLAVQGLVDHMVFGVAAGNFFWLAAGLAAGQQES